MRDHYHLDFLITSKDMLTFLSLSNPAPQYCDCDGISSTVTIAMLSNASRLDSLSVRNVYHAMLRNKDDLYGSVGKKL